MSDINGSNQADRLDGTSGDDTIWGFDGNDTIAGLAGNDRIITGDGVDVVDGGTGNDEINGFMIDASIGYYSSYASTGVKTIDGKVLTQARVVCRLMHIRQHLNQMVRRKVGNENYAKLCLINGFEVGGVYTPQPIPVESCREILRQ